MMNTFAMNWENSPMQGVQRKRMAYEEIERGHATSIVKFHPNSHFRQHAHPLGEEILVLDGIFSDEHDDYKAGCYIRNPEGFSHTPFSNNGCIILVKLHQFQTEDTQTVRIDINKSPYLSYNDSFDVLTLHEFKGEKTILLRFKNQSPQPIPSALGGEEIYILSGKASDSFGQYSQGTWLRSPTLKHQNLMVEKEAHILVKSGHLPT